MCKNSIHPALSTFLSALLACAAATALADPAPDAAESDSSRPLRLAQDERVPLEPQQPREDFLLTPNGLQQQEQAEERNCMTVCADWGQDCTYINRGMGGTTRSCRRVCRQFTEECF